MTEKKRIDWWVYTIPVLITLAVFFYILVQMRIKTVGLITFLLGPWVIVILSLILLFIAIISSLIKRPFFNKSRLIGFGILIILCFNHIIYGRFPSYFDDKPSDLEFRVPLDSSITVAWGGKFIKNNYHAEYPSQCWAYDLLITKKGKTFSNKGDKNDDYFCYGLEVLSPAKGKIIQTYNIDPDMTPGVLGGGKTALGNHIIIEVAKSQYLFLCHLKPKSIKVNIGDIVNKGQILALIGNSGNTSEPHLHLHLQNTKNLSTGEGIPLYFHNYLLNGQLIKRGIPKGGFDENDNLIGEIILHKE